MLSPWPQAKQVEKYTKVCEIVALMISKTIIKLVSRLFAVGHVLRVVRLGLSAQGQAKSSVST